jgi:protease PrsW
MVNGHVTPTQDSLLRQAITPWHQRTGVRTLLTILAVLIIGVGAILMLFIIGVQTGPVLLLFSIVFAAIPVPVLLLALMWLDKYEPEPWRYLAFTFGWGAFVATAIALFINTVGAELYGVRGDDDPRINTIAIFVAPPAEETMKALPLFIVLGLTLLHRRAIHGVVDGLVYAGYSAVGFAFTENILYFGAAYIKGDEVSDGAGPVAFFFTFIIRGILSPFAHPLFTAMTGIAIGLAVRNRNIGLRILIGLSGLLLAMGLHGLWNFLASTGNWKILLSGYFGIMLPLLAIVIGVAIWVRSREAQVTLRILPQYVKAGWLTQAELSSLSTMDERRYARDWARGFGGEVAAKAMQEFQLAATRLAMLREDVERGLVRREYRQSEQELLEIIRTRREMLLNAVTRWLQHWQHFQSYSYHAPVYARLYSPMR